MITIYDLRLKRDARYKIPDARRTKLLPNHSTFAPVCPITPHGFSLFTLHSNCLSFLKGKRLLPTHVSRLTSHASRLTPHVSRLTSHASRLTSHVFHFSLFTLISKLK